MGEVATKYAEMSVLTAEDPRTENVNQIIQEIAEGCLRSEGKEGKTFFRIPDRREAIKFALEQAKRDDIVVICGKGHEESMCFGTIEYPWSDIEETKKLVNNL